MAHTVLFLRAVFSAARHAAPFCLSGRGVFATRASASASTERRMGGHLAAEAAHGFWKKATCRIMSICLFFGIFVSVFQKTDTDKKSHAVPDVPSAGLFAQHAGLPFIINNNINRL